MNPGFVQVECMGCPGVEGLPGKCIGWPIYIICSCLDVKKLHNVMEIFKEIISLSFFLLPTAVTFVQEGSTKHWTQKSLPFCL